MSDNTQSRSNALWCIRATTVSATPTGRLRAHPRDALVSEKRLSRRDCRAWVLLLLMAFIPFTEGPAKAGHANAALATNCIPPHHVHPTGRRLSGRIPGAWNRALTAQRLRSVPNRAAWDQWHPWGVQSWPSSIAPPAGIYRTCSLFYHFTEVVNNNIFSFWG